MFRNPLNTTIFENKKITNGILINSFNDTERTDWCRSMRCNSPVKSLCLTMKSEHKFNSRLCDSAFCTSRECWELPLHSQALYSQLSNLKKCRGRSTLKIARFLDYINGLGMQCLMIRVSI